MSLTRRGSVRALLGLSLTAAIVFAMYEIAESPSSQLFGRTIVSGPKDERIVALTYDDGPNPPYTDAILSVLEREQVKATFFVVGRAVAAYPAIVRRAYRDGDAIGNHTWSHGHLVLYDSAGLQQTLQRTDAAIFAATGAHPRIMRPP
ncbi:MAG TPA: polysaccharide deacetylase family protein, partial [Candidatus Acidoferrum sp.]|nr:polysaccharide deacetylase family protein [Candidatus Acidoferrum sp.]